MLTKLLHASICVLTVISKWCADLEKLLQRDCFLLGDGLDRLLRTADVDRRYRTIQIRAGARTITAADSLPDDLDRIHRHSGAH
jgi:hypothetical protein